MKKSRKILITIIILLAIVVACIYVYGDKKPYNTDQQVETLSILGDWAPSLAGDDMMSFYIDEKNNHVYQSYIDGRPSIQGIWKLDGNRLTVSYPRTPKSQDVFIVVRNAGVMVLTDQDNIETVYNFVFE